MQYSLTLGIDLTNPQTPIAATVIDIETGAPVEPVNKAFVFKNGDRIELKIAAASAKKTDQIKVTSLALVSAPAGKKNNKSLSPFDLVDAAKTIRNWGLPQPSPANDDTHQILISALHPLSINAKKGRWVITGVLSILSNDDDQLQARAFHFDLTVKVP